MSELVEQQQVSEAELAEWVGFDEDQAERIEGLLDRMAAYDPAAPEAAHLRGHQIQAISRFREVSNFILSSEIPNRGMAILHPTGSGKTVTTAEIARLVCNVIGESEESASPHKVLMLVPGHQILQQTTGNEDEVGAIHKFAPGVSVAEYSGKKKELGADVTVMTYQALPWAIEKGIIDEIDPSVVVCDEAHHIIDGAWADAVSTIAANRLLVGLTATPSYSETRGVDRLFPYVLDRKSMIDGIEGGFLSELQGFTYKGKARVKATRRGKDYAEEDLFNAIAESEDNYLAAKICAREVEMGRQGVVSCVPGLDRAHAKIMAEILSNTKVKTPDGERNIRAAFVGGEVHEKELERIFKAYKAGEIDVITYVDLLLEGWDSPETDFTVLLRPTMSRVLAEQRIGRIIRSRQGKLATVHEILYTMEGSTLPQVTHMDILNEDKVIQGRHYAPRDREAADDNNRKRSHGPARIFSAEDFAVDPDLQDRIAELDAVAMSEVRIMCGQNVIPLEWNTSYILANLFKISTEEIEQVLQAAKIPSKAEAVEGVERTYYPPRAKWVIAEHLGLKEFPEGSVTMTDLTRHHRRFQQYRRVTRTVIEGALKDAGVEGGLFITASGEVVFAYPGESMDVPPVHVVPTNFNLPRKKEASHAVEKIDDTPLGIVTWLHGVLVNPEAARSNLERIQIRTAQSLLLAAIQRLGVVDPSLYKTIQEEIADGEIESTVQMENVMRARKLDFVGLIVAAGSAKLEFEKMKTKQGYLS